MIRLLQTETGGTVTQFFDTSSLQDTDAYWDALADRVARAARARRSGIAWLGADRSAWVAAACIVAIATAIGVVSRREPAAVQIPALPLALMPSDAIGRIIVGAQVPPAVAVLAVMAPQTGGGLP